MDEQPRSSLPDRIWYLPLSYKNNFIRQSWNSICSESAIPPQDWQNIDWEMAERGPHIFLSRAPITFAHSILVVPRPFQSSSITEAMFFRWSACLIERAIYLFNTAFKIKQIHVDADFKVLAEKTLSKGAYIKTLILKANANEDSNEVYKVHLLPYFESHDRECQQRFLTLHQAVDPENRKGGLLGWLGQREDEVDEYEVDYRLKADSAVTEMNDRVMKQLALIFRSLHWEHRKTINNEDING